MRCAHTGLLLLYALWFPHFSQAFDCDRIKSNGAEWNLSKLGGRRAVHEIKDTEMGVKNLTFELDLCAVLKKGDGDSDTDCKSGTRICAKEYFTKKGSDEQTLEDYWPIAGTFTDGASLDAKATRLKTTDSHEDSSKEGLRIQFNGGVSSDKEKKKQRAEIELVCDKEKTGLEGSSGKEEEKVRRADDNDGSGDDDDKNKSKPDGKQSLQLVRYGPEETDNGKEMDILRLEWKTKYACEDQFKETDPSDSKQSKSWGFFPWFVIIVFLAIASYLIFGSWLNYNRYGARGWDLLPHGDTIRDLPYLIKDLGRKVVSTVQGSGGSGRGGYSAL